MNNKRKFIILGILLFISISSIVSENNEKYNEDISNENLISDSNSLLVNNFSDEVVNATYYDLPTNYRAVYDFLDDDVGSVPNGFTEIGTDGRCKIVDEYDGHKNVLEIDSLSASPYAVVISTIDNANQGYVEFYLWATHNNGQFSLLITPWTHGGINFYMETDGNLKTYNGESLTTLAAYSAETKYHIKISWTNIYTFSFLINEVEYGPYSRSSPTTAISNYIRLRGVATSKQYYVDAIDFSFGNNILYNAEYNYENDNVGSIPSEWTISANQIGSVSGSHLGIDKWMLFTQVNTPSTSPSLMSFDSGIASEIDIEFYIYLAQTNKRIHITIMGDGGGWGWIDAILFRETGQFWTVNPAFNNWDITSYSANTLYHFRLHFNFDTKKRDMWINGVNRYTDYDFQAGSNHTKSVKIEISSDLSTGSGIQFGISCIDASFFSGYTQGRNTTPKQFVGKQGNSLYDGKYNFKDDPNWSTPSDFTTQFGSSVIVEKSFGMYKALRSTTNSNSYKKLYTQFPAKTSGTIEYYIALHQTDKIVQPVLQTDVGIYNGAIISWRSDGKIYGFDNNVMTEIRSYSANTVYHVKISWLNNQWSAWIDGILEVDDFTFYNYLGTSNNIVEFNVDCTQSGITFDLFAIDFSWDENYYDGRNKEIVNEGYYEGRNQFLEAIIPENIEDYISITPHDSQAFLLPNTSESLSRTGVGILLLRTSGKETLLKAEIVSMSSSYYSYYPTKFEIENWSEELVNLTFYEKGESDPDASTLEISYFDSLTPIFSKNYGYGQYSEILENGEYYIVNRINNVVIEIVNRSYLYNFNPNPIQLINDQDYSTNWNFISFNNLEPINLNDITSDPIKIYRYYDQFGSYGSGDGEFNFIPMLAINSSDYVYVADQNNRRVQIFDQDGNFISKFGSAGNNDGEFNLIGGIAINSSGYVYVTGQVNSRVQIFDQDGNFISKFGSAGSGDGEFNGIRAISINSNGYVYVTESVGNRIQIFDQDGNFISKFGSAGSGDGEFNNPYELSINSSNYVYIADLLNHRIQIFDQDGNFISKFGSYGSGDGEFKSPRSISINSSGYVYVADTGNNRIQIFDQNGNFISKFGSYGSGDGEFNTITGIDINSNDLLYISDNSLSYCRIQIFSNENFIFSSDETEIIKFNFENIENDGVMEIILNSTQTSEIYYQSTSIQFKDFVTLILEFNENFKEFSIKYIGRIELISLKTTTDYEFKTSIIVASKEIEKIILSDSIYLCSVYRIYDNYTENSYLIDTSISKSIYHGINVNIRQVFISLSNQRNEYLDWENYQIKINGSLIFMNEFYGVVGSKWNISIYSRWGVYLNHYEHTISSLLTNNWISIQIIQYSLKIYNQQSSFTKVNITLDPNYPDYYTSDLEWIEWASPGELLDYSFSPGYYKVNVTEYESNTETIYYYTLNGNDFLLISSDNTIFNVIENIKNVNTTIDNQISNVSINLANINSSINQSFINIEIFLDNQNTTIGQLLVDQSIYLELLNSSIEQMFIEQSSYLSSINSTISELLLNQTFLLDFTNSSIHSLLVDQQISLDLLHSDIGTYYAQQISKLDSVNSTISEQIIQQGIFLSLMESNIESLILGQILSIENVNSTIVEMLLTQGIIMENYNLTISNLMIDQILSIENMNSTIINMLLSQETFLDLIGSNITNMMIQQGIHLNITEEINNLLIQQGITLNVFNSSITNLLIEQSANIDLVLSDIHTLYMFSNSSFMSLNSSIYWTFFELENQLLFMETSISNFENDISNNLLLINSSIYGYMVNNITSSIELLNSTMDSQFNQLSQNVFLINNSIYTSVASLSQNLDLLNNTIYGNQEILVSMNTELTEIFINTLFASELNWTNAQINSSYIKDQIVDIEVLNEFSTMAGIIEFELNGVIQQMYIAASETGKYKVNKDAKMRILDTEGNILKEWQDVKTLEFGFYDAEIPDILYEDDPLWFKVSMFVILSIVVIGIISSTLVVIYKRYNIGKTYNELLNAKVYDNFR